MFYFNKTFRVGVTQLVVSLSPGSPLIFLSFVLYQGLFLKILLYKCVITISKPTPTKDT